MRLLYWYTRFLDKNGNLKKYHGLDYFELNLSTNMKFHFDVNTHKFSQEQYLTPLPDCFWGDRQIYNINAIVGKNGDGKTTLVHTVMDTLQELYDRELKSPNETLFFLEDNKEQVVFYLKGSQSDCKQIRTDYKCAIFNMGKITTNEDYLKYIESSRIIYFSNTISEVDNNRFYAKHTNKNVSDNYIYDCSLCNSIHHNEFSYIEYVYTHSQMDILYKYYVEEYFKQVKFVYDCKKNGFFSYLDERGFSVTVPGTLFFTIFDYSNIYKGIIDLVQYVKIQRTCSEKIIYCLCANCFYSFLFDINDDLAVWHDSIMRAEIPKVATFESFSELFKLIQKCFKSEKTHEKRLESLNKRVNDCLKFLEYICCKKTKKILDGFEEYEGDFDKIDEISSITVTAPVNEKNINWIKSFIDYYHSSRAYYLSYLEFNWGLSSGENNLLRLLYNLFYAFDYFKNNLAESGVFNSALILIDEADLTFHPEWQRRFIKILTDVLPFDFGKGEIENLQLILTTHSPLLLSDFPANNITYLGSNKNGSNSITFGQNIHTIMKDNFFLSSSIGDFAKTKINETAKKLRDKEHLTFEELNDCRSIIDLVAPGILKNKLKELFESAIINDDDVSLKEQLRGLANELSTQKLKCIVAELSTEIERRNND